MSVASRNALAIGLLIGLITVWSNWPADAIVTDLLILDSFAQVVGAMAAVWFVVYLINPKRRR